jgi:Tol biopolymer transport system component
LFAGGPSHQGEKAVIRSISVLTGSVQAVADEGFEAEASPDGKEIVYVGGDSREIKLAGSQGESPRTFFHAPEGDAVASVHWLPGGKRIGYLRGKNGAAEATIETRDLRGGDVRPVLEAPTETIAFAPDGRVFYTTKEASPQEVVALWTVTLDPATGARTGEPVKVSVWPGAIAALPLTISADGRRLALTKMFAQSDVYLLELDAGGTTITSSRQLTTDTQVDWPSQWSRDGSSFLFFSNRSGTFHAFRQPIAAETPEPLVTGAAQIRSPQTTADGKWIVYVEMTNGPKDPRIMRVPVTGGPSEEILTVSTQPATASLQFFAAYPGSSGTGARSFPDVRCPTHFNGSCVLAEARVDEKEHRTRVVLSTFDPARGQRRELATIADDGAGTTFWDVSPDGSTIAFGQFDWGGGDQVTLLRPAAGERRVVRLKDFKNLADVAWAEDGRSLFATTETIRGGQLLHVMLDGTTHLLRAFDGRTVLKPRPSPDGRSLLLGVIQTNSNAWVIEPR